MLAEDGFGPLPEGLTPRSLRRTFASLLFALGETPPYVMAQMGHTTPNLTLAIYARQMDRRDGEPERLKALVEGRNYIRSPPLRSANPGQALCRQARSCNSIQWSTTVPLTKLQSPF